jgi:hypothetical protein
MLSLFTLILPQFQVQESGPLALFLWAAFLVETLIIGAFALRKKPESKKPTLQK